MAKRAAPAVSIQDDFARLSLRSSSRRRACGDAAGPRPAAAPCRTGESARAALMRQVRDDPSQQALYVFLRYQPDRRRLREVHQQALARRRR